MKRLFTPLAAAVLLCASAAWLAPRESCAAAEPDAGRVTLSVEGMTCGACATSVKVVLKRLDGVTDAKVSLGERKAFVTYDPAKVTPEKMVEEVRSRLPYKAKVLAPANGK